MNPELKTWVEIDRKSISHNFKILKSQLKPGVKFFSVVKSNAYGHGLIDFSKIVDDLGIDGFCVDSVIEGAKLREEYIKKPVLVLGPTLSSLFYKALDNNITITVSNWESLRSLKQSKYKPNFHLKIDTGMRRQGFYIEDIPKVIQFIKQSRLESYLRGVYTHFASAKDINYPTFTDLQFQKFNKTLNLLAKAGFKKILRHASATGGVLINKKYNLDAVRIGIGLYGFWPSKELGVQKESIKLALKPVLSWRALISEIKLLKAGDYIGYDLVERVYKDEKVAVVPIGYWHGFPRLLSGIGSVLVNGRRARVLGRVSMDLISIDVTDIKCKVGDIATIVGARNKESISAYEIAGKVGTSHYEIVTRINPLIERIIK